MSKVWKKRIKNLIRYIVMTAALVLFGFSAYSMADTQLGYNEGSEFYVNMEENFFVPAGTGTESDDDSSGGGFEIENVGDGQEFVFDYAALKKYNKHSIGWIRLDDGQYISYPVVQYTDNDYYLRRLISRRYNVAGTIFVDYRCEGGFNARNPIVYGHNMNNYTMFGSLREYYNKKNYYKEHPYFDIWIGEEHYTYYVFSVRRVELADTYVYKFNYASDEEYLEYINKCIADSKVAIDVGEITAEDHIMTLSTCVYNHPDQRLVLNLVRRETPAE